MCRIFKIIISFIFIATTTYSQETKRFFPYKTLKIIPHKRYGKWHSVSNLEKGLIIEHKYYSKKTVTRIQKNVYDKHNNIIYEIRLYDIDNGYKVDTIFRYSNDYDDQNRLIKKRYHFGLIENYSDFNKNSKPRLITRPDNKSLFFRPLKEELEYDSIGNLVKEIHTEIEYPSSKNDTIKKYTITINQYKYDLFGNIIEIRRQNNPKIEYPIIMTGGLPLYELENFKYKYNKDGLWLKKYWIAGGRKILLQKRKFEK